MSIKQPANVMLRAAGIALAFVVSLPGATHAQEAQIQLRQARPVPEDPRAGQLAGEEAQRPDEMSCEEIQVIVSVLGVGIACKDYTTKNYFYFVVDGGSYPEMSDRVVTLLSSNRIVGQLEEDIGMEQWLVRVRHRDLKPTLQDQCDLTVRSPANQTCREAIRVRF